MAELSYESLSSLSAFGKNQEAISIGNSPFKCLETVSNCPFGGGVVCCACEAEPSVRGVREPGLLGYNVLHALGLIREDRAGNRGSTPLLQRLFAIGYYKKKHKK
jgi:hypothetical protein